MAKKTKNKIDLLTSSEETVMKYELALVTPPILPDDVKKRVLPKVEKLVEGLGGKLSVRDEWGKRHLAYEIDGNEEGYYLFCDLEIPSTAMEKLQADLTRLKDVIRFLIIKEEDKKSKSGKNLSKEVREACPFNGNPDLVDYKDVYNLRKKFITTRGRILPATKTGVSHRCQRKLTVAIKRARYLALLPYANYT